MQYHHNVHIVNHSTVYRLRYLNLDNNEIHTIPHLRLLGSGAPDATSSTEQHPKEEEEEEEEEDSELMAANGAAVRVGDEVLSPDQVLSPEGRKVPVVTPAISPDASDLSLAPFPELHTLSLVNNMVGSL